MQLACCDARSDPVLSVSPVAREACACAPYFYGLIGRHQQREVWKTTHWILFLSFWVGDVLVNLCTRLARQQLLAVQSPHIFLFGHGSMNHCSWFG